MFWLSNWTRSHKSCNKSEYKLAQWSLAGFPDSLFTRESKNDTNYQLGDYSKFALALSLAGWRVKIYWEPNHFSKRFKDFEETSVDFIGFIHNPPTWTLQVKSFFKVFTNCELVISNEDYLNDHQHREKGIALVWLVIATISREPALPSGINGLWLCNALPYYLQFGTLDPLFAFKWSKYVTCEVFAAAVANIIPGHIEKYRNQGWARVLMQKAGSCNQCGK